MVLKLHNTLTRKTEDFTPITTSSVSLYTCGPTVYNYPHIGNYRAYLFGDILKRTLIYNGYQVEHIMNLTDIDDKTIRDSIKAGKSLLEFTEFYTQEFFKDRDALHIIPAKKYTKATDYIPEMVAMTEQLIEKGFAYKSDDGSVYFSIAKDPEYGKLAHLDRSALETNAGGRMAADEYDKDNAQDFALWKAWDANDGDVFWENSLGKGRPGWHIECSAMSIANLGETIDIHTGGVDNMFPHHENEIAQSECATGKPFVKYWMHNEWLMVDGKKMAKSAGNFYTLRDVIEKGHNPLAFRYLSMLAHYRTPLNFTWEALEAAGVALRRLMEAYRSFEYAGIGEVSTAYQAAFHEAVNEDLNIPKALGIVWKMLGDSEVSEANKRASLLDFDQVLGFGLAEIKKTTLPNEIQNIVTERDEARKNKDWKRSDELRDTLAELGYDVLDTSTGTEVQKVRFEL